MSVRSKQILAGFVGNLGVKKECRNGRKDCGHYGFSSRFLASTASRLDAMSLMFGNLIVTILLRHGLP